MVDHILFPAFTFWLFPFFSFLIALVIAMIIFPNPNPAKFGPIMVLVSVVSLISLVFVEIIFDFVVFAIPFNLDNILSGIDASIGRLLVGFVLYQITSFLVVIIGRKFPSLSLDQVGCVSSFVVIVFPIALMICIGLWSKTLSVGAFYVEEFSSSLIYSHLKFSRIWASALVQTTLFLHNVTLAKIINAIVLMGGVYQGLETLSKIYKYIFNRASIKN